MDQQDVAEILSRLKKHEPGADPDLLERLALELADLDLEDRPAVADKIDDYIEAEGVAGNLTVAGTLEARKRFLFAFPYED